MAERSVVSRDSIVAKFGGTSMADAAAITQSAKVVVLNGVSMVVVSAVSGMTNTLVRLTAAVLAGDQPKADKIAANIIASHKKIADDLDSGEEVRANLEAVFDELLIASKATAAEAGQKQTADRIAGFGERLSSNLMIAALNRQDTAAELIDAKTIIKTDDHFGHATPLIKEIKSQADKVLKPKIALGKILVTQGFIGSSPDGMTTTLGRGGSDYTAALLAEALGADKLEIWTDTPGIASTDPRIVKHARRIEQMTLQEAAELATAGAKILYPKTITPLRRAHIALYVGNTFAPEAGGTTISTHTDRRPLVRAIALKTNQYLLRLTNPEMAYQFGYLAKAFDTFAEFKVSIDQISTSEISIAVVVEGQTLLNKALLRKLEAMGEVSIEKGLSVISVIGNDVNNAPGLAQDIFGSLQAGGDKVSVRMICQGASRHNFCFLVADEYGRSAVQRLHKAFIE